MAAKKASFVCMCRATDNNSSVMDHATEENQFLSTISLLHGNCNKLFKPMFFLGAYTCLGWVMFRWRVLRCFTKTSRIACRSGVRDLFWWNDC